MDHSELIAEMTHIEKLTTQERLRLAHKRRMQQMKRWSQREKEWNNKRNKMLQNEQKKRRTLGNRVHFVNSVMLLEAAGRNDIDEVRRLLIDGVSPDSTNEDGLTALHQCCIDDNQDMMILLLDYGANVNAEDSERWTPLHAAATCGHLHLVKYLISKGANLLSVNADGNMPYDICEDDSTLDYIELEMAKRGVTQDLIEETRSASEIVMLADLKYLVENGGELENKDHMGATPLHVASANGYITVVEFLLDHHVSTDVRDNDAWQPIHAAACWGHPEVLELLVQNGADLDAQTRNHETPQDICEDPELRERIIQLRSELESKRQQDAQRKKIRRSQSSNTRTQSIRRTSYREKNLTSKKEAVEEAKIRIQMGHETPPQLDNRILSPQISKEEPSDEPDDPIDVAMLLQLKRDTHGDIRLSTNERNKLLRMEADGQESVGSEGEKEDSSGVVISNNNNNNSLARNGKVQEMQDNVIADGLHSSSGENGSKIDIHVSVTINTNRNNNSSYKASPGTLADLKKQRSLSRTSISAGTNHVLSSSADNLHTASDNVSTGGGYEAPPSPTISLRRFAGMPSEEIGTPEKQGCCVIL